MTYWTTRQTNIAIVLNFLAFVTLCYFLFTGTWGPDATQIFMGGILFTGGAFVFLTCGARFPAPRENFQKEAEEPLPDEVEMKKAA